MTMTPKLRLWLVAAVIWSAWYAMDPDARPRSSMIDTANLHSPGNAFSSNQRALTDHGIVLGSAL